MRVGLYFDLRNPPQWRVDPSRLYGFTLEMCEEAEQLGIDSLWVTEHHGFDDGYLSQPLTMLSAMAARTRRVRLGTGIAIAPLHAAVELAEQAAIVDIISGGRVELGLGAGYRVPEYDLYGADISKRYGTTDERVREIRRLWESGAVTPQPVQQRVPIWLGYQGPQGARRAGLLGESLMSPDPANYPPYRDALARAGHDPAIARMAGGIQSWVTEDPERDWELVSKHLAYQIDSYLRHMVEGTDSPPPRPVDPDKLRTRDPRGPLGYVYYGTPGDVAGRILDYTAGAPVDTVYVWASIGGMPEEVVARQVRLVCDELAPLLRAESAR
jgi:alkanesulfonate monooxygenase SsuD/methylene tetrahydromethanopterin reductase-like flavin-dependent oxidoreductase (luciferase family)